MALSRMQFGEQLGLFDKDKYYEHPDDREEKIAAIRKRNADYAYRHGEISDFGKYDPPVEVIQNQNGNFIGTGDTWHDREELRTRRLYHGSPNPIPIGDHVIPGATAQRGGLPHLKGIVDETHREVAAQQESVFTTPNREAAAEYAAVRAGGWPIFVHEVAPEGMRDTQHWGQSYQSERAKVLRRWSVEEFGDEEEEFDEPKQPQQLKLKGF